MTSSASDREANDLVAGIMSECESDEESALTVFHAAEQRGIDLAGVVTELYFGYYDDFPEGLVLALVEHLGSVDGAQSVLRRARGLEHVDVAAIHRCERTSRRARKAMEDGLTVNAVAAIIREGLDPSVDDAFATYLWSALAKEGELAELITLPDAPQAPWKAVLPKRCSALKALQELAPQLGEEATLAALAQYWLVPRGHEASIASEFICTLSTLTRSAFLPLRTLIAPLDARYARSEWLPVLRRQGLDATAVVLHAFEERKVSAGTIAVELMQSGYADTEVLAALAANGISMTGALTTLRESNWNTERMTATLVQRGLLAHEVRDQLLELGLGTQQVRLLLAQHVNAEVVELVMPDSKNARAS